MNNLNQWIYHIFAAIALAIATMRSAHAEGAAAGGASEGFASLIPLLLIMVIFYFLLIRPQQKKLKEHKSMVESTKKGDKVLTGGGILGKITDVKDDVLTVEIADGVRVKVKRDTIIGPVKSDSNEE